MAVKAKLLQAPNQLPPPLFTHSLTHSLSSDHISHHHRKTKIASFHSSMTGWAPAHITERERETKSRQFWLLSQQEMAGCRSMQRTDQHYCHPIGCSKGCQKRTHSYLLCQVSEKYYIIIWVCALNSHFRNSETYFHFMKLLVIKGRKSRVLDYLWHMTIHTDTNHVP